MRNGWWKVTFDPSFKKTRSVKDILASATSALGQFKPQTVSEPSQFYPLNYKYQVYQVLYPEGFEWQDVIINCYEELPPVGASDMTIIVHGHPRGIVCSSPTMCHIFGYQPTGEENSLFLTRFRKKFNYVEQSSSEGGL